MAENWDYDYDDEDDDDDEEIGADDTIKKGPSMA